MAKKPTLPPPAQRPLPPPLSYQAIKERLEKYLNEDQRGGLTIFEEVRRQGINKLVKRRKETETVITNELEVILVSDFGPFFDKFEEFKEAYEELDTDNSIVKKIDRDFFFQQYMSEESMFPLIKEWGKILQSKHLYRKLLSSLTGIINGLFNSMIK